MDHVLEYVESLCVYSENGICTHPKLRGKSCDGSYWAIPKCKSHTTQYELRIKGRTGGSTESNRLKNTGEKI